MPTTIAPPATVAVPTWNPAANRQPGPLAYAALHRVDPELLPPTVVEIARQSQRLAAMAPAKSDHVSDALAVWRQQVLAAAQSDDATLPDLAAVADAYAMAEAAKATSATYRQLWEQTLAPIATILADHGDELVQELQPVHDQSWIDFTEHVQALDGIRSAEAVIVAGAEASSHFQAAGHRLSTFAATRAARTALHELRGYRAACPDDLITFRHPEELRGVKLPKDTLPRWRAMVDAYAAAQPWMPTKAEAEAEHAQRESDRKAGVG